MAELGETIESASGEEFLRAISLRGPHFRARDRRLESGMERWIFRGQRDDWPLIPSALRTGSCAPLLYGEDGWAQRVCSKHQAQFASEYASIQKFFWEADGQGQSLPNDSEILRRQLARFDWPADEDAPEVADGLQERFWPSASLLPTVALAQHHGLATRLLDWTRKPYVAAYFAAREAARLRFENRSQGERLVVYAFKASVLERGYGGKWHPILSLVAAPRHGNPNLHAQAGVFTCRRLSSLELGEAVDRRTFEELISPGMPNYFEADFPVLKKFMLPVRFATELLWLLSLEGMAASAVFPGFGGVVEALRDEQTFAGLGLPPSI